MTRLGTGRLGFDYWQGQWRDFFSSPPRPNWLWDPLSPLFSRFRGLFSRR